MLREVLIVGENVSVRGPRSKLAVPSLRIVSIVGKGAIPTVERRGLRRHSIGYFHSLMESLLAYDCGSLYFAEYQGMRLATALVIYFGDTASYKYGGSLPVHRNVMAPYLLHFEVSEERERTRPSLVRFLRHRPAGQAR